jgi:hypothetical protein
MRAQPAIWRTKPSEFHARQLPTQSAAVTPQVPRAVQVVLGPLMERRNVENVQLQYVGQGLS